MKFTARLLLASLLMGPVARAQSGKSADAIAVIVDAERGTLLRWALPEGEFPRNGFRVERAVGGGRAEAIATVRPQVEAPSSSQGGSHVAALVRDFLARAAEGGSVDAGV